MLTVEKIKENTIKLSKKVKCLIGGVPVKQLNIFVKSYKSIRGSRYALSIREDRKDNSYKLSQVSLSQEEIVQLRDTLNLVIEENQD